MYLTVSNWPTDPHYIIRESVDSLCRDGAETPIVRVHHVRKPFYYYYLLLLLIGVYVQVA